MYVKKSINSMPYASCKYPGYTRLSLFNISYGNLMVLDALADVVFGRPLSYVFNC